MYVNIALVIQDLTNTVPICKKKGDCNTFHANSCNQGHKILSKIAFIAFIVLSSIVGILKRNLSVLRSASCRDLDSK